MISLLRKSQNNEYFDKEDFTTFSSALLHPGQMSTRIYPTDHEI